MKRVDVGGHGEVGQVDQDEILAPVVDDGRCLDAFTCMSHLVHLDALWCADTIARQ